MWERRKRVWWISNTFLCNRIYNFWGSSISGDEQQRPVNEATIGNTVRVPKDVALPSRRAPYSCFVNRPLLFITTNQRSPKVVHSAAQRNVLEIHQTLFFSTPTQKEKSGLGTRLWAIWVANAQGRKPCTMNVQTKLFFLFFTNI